MANNIDNIYSKQAIAEIDIVYNGLVKTHEEILKLSKINLDFMGGSAPKNPAQLQSIVSDFSKIEAASTKMTEKIVANRERERATEIKAQQAREKAVDSFTKNEQKVQEALLKSENVYNKIQAKVNSMVPTYNNLQSKVAIGIRLSAQEQSQLALLTNRLNKYQDALKSTDATIGKHQREVGNYAKANSNLSNSIGQIARELPNFGQSFSVGVLSLTNNIGALQDAIKQTTAQNKVLAAEGQATKSVLSQVVGQIFSMNVALYVAIGLFSAFSKEIGEWVSSLFNGSEGLKELTENQKKFNEAKFNGKKEAQEDILNLQKYLEVAKDDKVSMEERQIALKKLRDEFPFYFKNLSDIDILTGKYGENVKKLNIALEKQKEIEDKTKIAVSNKQKLLDLEKEAKSTIDLIKIKKENWIYTSKLGNLDASSRALDVLIRAQAKQTDILKAIDAYKKADIKNDSNIFRLKKDIIGLEYQEDKNAKNKIKNIKDLKFENADYLASQYALLRAEKEAAARTAEQLYKDESQSFEQRIISYQVFSDKKLELADMAFEENKRLADKSLIDEKVKAKREYDEFVKNKSATDSQKISALSKYNRYVESINLQHGYKLSEIELKYSNEVLDIQKEVFTKQQELRDKQYRISENTKINEQELKDYRQYQLQLINVTKNITLKGLQAIEDEKTANVKKSEINRLNLEIQAISDQMVHEKEGSEAWIKLNDLRIAKTKDRTDKETDEAAKAAAKVKKYLEDTKAYFESFQQSGDSFGFKSLDFFLKMDKEGKTAFQNLVLNAENSKLAISSAFLAVSEVFQDIMNAMNQASEIRYQNDIKRLESQKNLSIQFAGDSETAKAEVERQYEVKRKKLDKEQAERKKKIALYNAGIDIAQAVLAGFIQNGYLGAIFAAALGAAQIAIISSMPVPEFAKGTDNAPAGLAWTQEKGAEIITDKKGKVKSLGNNKGAQLTMMEAGDKVFTAEKSKQLMFDTMLGSILNENNILPAIAVQNNNGLSKDEFNAGIEKLYNKQGLLIQRDSRGERLYEIKNGNKIEIKNARLKTKGFDV